MAPTGDRMTYLCLAYEEEARLQALSPLEWDSLRSATLAYAAELETRGHLLRTHALQSTRVAVTVRVRQGRPSITDGPFAATREQLGGFFLISAADLNQAIQLAARWPSARLGSIEVRPIEPVLPLAGRYPAGRNHTLDDRNTTED